ncbi:histidine phosphatase family protein [Blautia sp. An249]|uniref:histidine phosphatase family protein n=1 Tax=Blautia sp. An249 TaxID=1965603 RepID=UPI000B36AE68|nr:histidine phosphatase family protein [Blautia sp. An249]OUO81132.1 histidine phosphatase family protein [Blautia sp. An249]
MIKLWLIRHSMTEGNKKKRYIGTTDEPLCREGKELLKEGIYPRPDLIFTSPMIRCVQTAGILFPKYGLHIIEELAECDFGEFENKNYLELEGNTNYQKWIDSGGLLPFPGGESREEFKRRTLWGFRKALSLCMLEKAASAALVIHGGSIMNIMEAFGTPSRDFYQWHVKNGCGYEVQVDEARWQQGKEILTVLGEIPKKAGDGS